MMHIIKNARIDTQPDNGYYDKLAVLNKNLWVAAMKCPCTVYEIIGSGRDNETHGIREIFMRLNYFFKKICNAKINDHSNKSGNTKPEKFEYEILNVKIFHCGKGNNSD
jgi:hypothetical protein